MFSKACGLNFLYNMNVIVNIRVCERRFIKTNLHFATYTRSTLCNIIIPQSLNNLSFVFFSFAFAKIDCFNNIFTYNNILYNFLY